MKVVIVADIVWTSDEGQQYWDRGGVLRRGKTKREEVDVMAVVKDRGWEDGNSKNKIKNQMYIFLFDSYVR
jgi:hypothetical protein